MKIFAVGMNYAAHNKELHHSLDLLEPVIFMKADSVLKDGKPFFIPDFSNEVHYETEVVIKICRLGKNIDERFAPRYYDEVTVGIDFTARDRQRELRDKGFQQANTCSMLFPIPRIVAYVSRFLTLRMGDLIYAGTPAGVGPVRIGDHLEGFLENRKVLDFYVR